MEHIGGITQVIRKATENKGDLVVLYLDLANACSSTPQKLVLETRERHHVQDALTALILDY